MVPPVALRATAYNKDSQIRTTCVLLSNIVLGIDTRHWGSHRVLYVGAVVVVDIDLPHMAAAGGDDNLGAVIWCAVLLGVRVEVLWSGLVVC